MRSCWPKSTPHDALQHLPQGIGDGDGQNMGCGGQNEAPSKHGRRFAVHDPRKHLKDGEHREDENAGGEQKGGALIADLSRILHRRRHLRLLLVQMDGYLGFRLIADDESDFAVGTPFRLAGFADGSVIRNDEALGNDFNVEALDGP